MFITIKFIYNEIKLLKKVRKRFAITHYPKGYKNQRNCNLYMLSDSYDEHFKFFVQNDISGNNPKYVNENLIFKTEKECINYLKSYIIETLRLEGYRGKKDIIYKEKAKKVWYV